MREVSRRSMISVVMLSALGACSRPIATVTFDVELEAIAAVKEVVRAFAASHRYEPAEVIGGDPNGLYYRGSLSRFEFYASPHVPGSFTADFIDNRAFPQDDIYGRLSNFIAAVRQIEGVSIPEGYE